MSEIINLINVSANIYITNKFLGGSFLTYGIDVLKYYQKYEHRFNPMEIVFPRLTKCNFYKYGPSGTIQNLDAMCILAQNVLNEKIYLVLWIWFFTLTIISVFALVYRLALIAQMMTKTTMLFNMFKFTNNKRTISSLVEKFQVRKKYQYNVYLCFNFNIQFAYLQFQSLSFHLYKLVFLVTLNFPWTIS